LLVLRAPWPVIANRLHARPNVSVRAGASVLAMKQSPDDEMQNRKSEKRCDELQPAMKHPLLIIPYCNEALEYVCPE
jgi:hypothetical protein